MKLTLAAASILALLSTSPAVAGYSGLRIIKTYKIGGTGGWDYANFDTVTKRLYVTHGSSIAAIDTVTGAITPHLADASGAGTLTVISFMARRG
ncbi:MAG: hypothetical protein WBQ60_01475 [Asticcacaulis sp.]